MKPIHELYMIWPKEHYVFPQDVISLAQSHYHELERMEPGYHTTHDIDFPTDIYESVDYLSQMNLAYFRETPRNHTRLLGKFRKTLDIDKDSSMYMIVKTDEGKKFYLKSLRYSRPLWTIDKKRALIFDSQRECEHIIEEFYLPPDSYAHPISSNKKGL